MMAPALRTTLRRVAEALAPCPDGWWIIGSAAMALHGVDPGQVNDVDLLVDEGLALAVLERLGLKPIVLPPDPLFRSATFARWNAWPMRVEIMAGLQVSRGGRWHPVEPCSRELVMLDEASVFVPNRHELLAILRLFGRAKDRPRIQALTAVGAAVLPAAPAR